MNLSDESSFAVQLKFEKTVPSVVDAHITFPRRDEQLSIVYDRFPPRAFVICSAQCID